MLQLTSTAGCTRAFFSELRPLGTSRQTCWRTKAQGPITLPTEGARCSLWLLVLVATGRLGMYNLLLAHPAPKDGRGGRGGGVQPTFSRQLLPIQKTGAEQQPTLCRHSHCKEDAQASDIQHRFLQPDLQCHTLRQHRQRRLHWHAG